MRGRRRQWLGAGVVLASAPAEGGAWNVLAYAVDLKGRGATLTRATFEQCVSNFTRYPKVPVVLEHADTAGGPPEWAAPHGWVTALRVGTGARPDGTVVATLEGQVALDAATKPLVAGDTPTWPFGSVTILFNVQDEESGADLGAMLWSFSLTAHPALIDAPRLAASRVLAAGSYWGEVNDRDDLVAALRQIFDLPALAPEADVIAALDAFEKLATGDPADAQGVEVGDLLCQLRSTMRLPALSTTADVIAQVRKGLAAQPAASEPPPPMNAALPRDVPAQVAPAPVEPDEGAIHEMSRGAAAHTENGMKTAMMLAAALGLTAKDDAAAMLALVPFAEEALNTRASLNLAPGAPSTAVTAALTKAVTDAAQLPKAQAELSMHRKAEADALALARTKHIDEVIAAQPELAPARKSLELHAAQDWAGFQVAYPAPSREELSQRAQDAARREPITRGRAGASRDVAGGDAREGHELAALATSLVQQAQARGETLSFADAVQQATHAAVRVEVDDNDDNAGR